jgi:hypothetical protein
MTESDYVWLAGQALLSWLVGFGSGLALRYYRKFFESAVE